MHSQSVWDASTRYLKAFETGLGCFSLHTCDGAEQVAWDAPRLPGLVAHITQQCEGQPMLGLERLRKKRGLSLSGLHLKKPVYSNQRRYR